MRENRASRGKRGEMTQPDRLDGTDVRLLHALQVEPRASWQDLAPIVQADAATLARRWARLRDEGLAWSSGYTMAGQWAMLEIECEHGRLQQVVERLRRDPEALVVDVTSGPRDLLVLTQTRNLAGMTDYATVRLGQTPGLRTVRTHLIDELLVEAVSWRLRALTKAEAQQIPPPRPPRPRAARTVSDDLEAALLAELGRDGRTPIGVLAERTGYPPQRISDAIATLRATDRLRLRTDIARSYSDWPVYTWYFIDAPGRAVETLRRQLGTIPEVRFAAATASQFNVILAVWLRRLADINRLEVALADALPGLRIVERAVVMRMEKHLGRVIGPDGRAQGMAADLPAEASGRPARAPRGPRPARAQPTNSSMISRSTRVTRRGE